MVFTSLGCRLVATSKTKIPRVEPAQPELAAVVREVAVVRLVPAGHRGLTTTFP
jgi:hypothetical protein